MMNKVIVVVDMQNDFVDGSLGTKEAQDMLPRLVRKLDAEKGQADFIFTMDTHAENYESVELVGVCTDICVISNALLIKAFFPEKKISVDASCCAGVTPESHANALDAMKMCHIEIV